MEIKENTDVFTFDGQKVGRISRMVIDPKTKELPFPQIDVYFLSCKLAAQQFAKRDGQQCEEKTDANEYLQNDGAFISGTGYVQS